MSMNKHGKGKKFQSPLLVGTDQLLQYSDVFLGHEQDSIEGNTLRRLSKAPFKLFIRRRSLSLAARRRRRISGCPAAACI
ncbi:hypothetical protein T12_16802 [Trichinella patagoniensis]|uniref:Uncharacterized protein n=1 Tax=Trichinella patagoniensis TaxID=990121 RepID=A0A0V0ZNK3_9BILA|nr:hypothetical protein T12_16802 [Trichinella patagoniensis]